MVINDKSKLVVLARNNGCNLSDNFGVGLASPPPSALPSSRAGVDPRCSNYHFKLTSYNRQIAFYDDKANTSTSVMSRNNYLSRKNELINDKSRLIELAKTNGCNLYGSTEPGLAAPPSTRSVPARGTRNNSIGRGQIEPPPTLESSTPRISRPLSTGRSAATPPPAASSSSQASGDSSKCNNMNSRLAYYDRQIADYDAKARSATSASRRNSYLESKNTYINDKNRMLAIARSSGCR